MAAAAYALDGVVQNNADLATGWSSGAIDSETQIEGAACIGAKVGAGLTRRAHTGTSRDFSAGGANGGDHVLIWYNVLTFANLDTLANGGVRILAGNDNSANFREYYVTGLGAGYFGGWVAAIVDPTATPDLTVGSPDETTFDTFGTTFNMTSGIMGNFNNALTDQITIGRGLILTAGDGASTPGDFNGFLNYDEGTNIYGFVSRVNNIVLSQCKFFIGNGTTATEFEDTSQVVVFLDRPVAADFYEIRVDTDAICTFGAISGGNTSQGCSFDSAGPAKYTVTAVEGGTVEAVLNAYASTFRNYRQMDLNPSTTFRDCVLVGGDARIALNGASIENCSINASLVGADAGALLLDNDVEFQNGGDPLVKNVSFSGHNANANSGAIRITDPGTYDFIGITFSNNSFDIINDTGGLVTINVTGGGTTAPSVLNVDPFASTTINANVSLTLTGLQANSEVRLYSGTPDNASAATELDGVENSGTTQVLSFGAAGNGYLVIAKNDYENEIIEFTPLPTSDTSIPINQRFDRTYSNP